MKDRIIFKKNEWFFESPIPYDVSNEAIGLKIKKKLYSGESPFQKIEIYDTFDFGKILVLDGILQTSEKDEFIYHEMLCQVPIFLHKNPRKVLIVGGGDGGSLEEVLKHKIEKVWMAEIDRKVIKVSEKYLPSISKGAFKNKKAEIVVGDGKEFIKKYKDFFDVVILDLSDPAGPAKDLISLDFYKKVKRALKKNGLVSIQSGSLDDQIKLVATIFKRIRKIFPVAEIRRAVIPSYWEEYSFIVGSKANLKKITFKDIEKRYKKSKLDLKYYSPEIHFVSKVFPKYLRKNIKR
jgi:spermidine synthase